MSEQKMTDESRIKANEAYLKVKKTASEPAYLAFMLTYRSSEVAELSRKIDSMLKIGTSAQAIYQMALALENVSNGNVFSINEQMVFNKIPESQLKVFNETTEAQIMKSIADTPAAKRKELEGLNQIVKAVRDDGFFGMISQSEQNNAELIDSIKKACIKQWKTKRKQEEAIKFRVDRIDEPCGKLSSKMIDAETADGLAKLVSSFVLATPIAKPEGSGEYSYLELMDMIELELIWVPQVMHEVMCLIGFMNASKGRIKHLVKTIEKVEELEKLKAVVKKMGELESKVFCALGYKVPLGFHVLERTRFFRHENIQEAAEAETKRILEQSSEAIRDAVKALVEYQATGENLINNTMIEDLKEVLEKLSSEEKIMAMVERAIQSNKDADKFGESLKKIEVYSDENHTHESVDSDNRKAFALASSVLNNVKRIISCQLTLLNPSPESITHEFRSLCTHLMTNATVRLVSSRGSYELLCRLSEASMKMAESMIDSVSKPLAIKTFLDDPEAFEKAMSDISEGTNKLNVNAIKH